MLKPLEQFICDSCKDVIEKPEDGWFEWLSIPNGKGNYINQNFRICHHNGRCERLMDENFVSDNHLQYFIGESALVHLLSKIDLGPYHEREYKGPKVKDFREFTEILRRFTLPYYEEARQWWSEAMSDGYFTDENELTIYRSGNLMRMIQHYSE